MAFYEHVIVSRPDISPQQVESLVEEVTKIVQGFGGTVGKTEYWGLRNLAYPINKVRKAHYSLLNLDIPTVGVAELERRLLIHDDVMRFMTIRVEKLDDEPSPVLSRRSDREDRPRGDREDRPRGDRGDRDDRPRGDRGDRGDREDRPRRRD